MKIFKVIFAIAIIATGLAFLGDGTSKHASYCDPGNGCIGGGSPPQASVNLSKYDPGDGGVGGG